jgi:uncharacterized protein (DUF1501 family)
MTLHRRNFLKNSLAAGSMVAWGLSVPNFLCRTAFAAPNSDKPGAKETILVVVQLTGGNDGLNTVVPFKDAEYAKLRPTLKLADTQIHKLTDEIALHPEMGGLAGLYEDKALCVVQGVGYPNPNQSHFRSMDIWQSANPTETVTEGWVGKALKGLPRANAFHVANGNEPSPLALNGALNRVPSITSLDDFQLRTESVSGSDKKDQKQVIEDLAKTDPNRAALLGFVQRTALNTYESSKRLQEIGKNYEPKETYPQTAFANRLKLAAQLIDADLGARIYYVSIDGFDTHASQAPGHAKLLQEVSGAMTAFFKDLAARGHRDRIMMMTFSEFGRRAKENGSKGTDHGSAAPMLLVGGKVKAGIVGAHPSLTDLEIGNLKHHTDFRRVYAAVLDQWLGVPSKEILGGKFDPLDVLNV